MALLHEMLYQGAQRGRVDFAVYARRIAAQTLRGQGEGARIASRVEVDPVAIEIGIAVPCGLILHELLANSVEHAFPDGRRGEIEISGRHDRAGGTLVLHVGDDGVGTADRVGGADRIGLELVERLVRQVGGTLARVERPGTHWRLELPTGGERRTPDVVEIAESGS
jgi:two-component sensor histidine kinase